MSRKRNILKTEQRDAVAKAMQPVLSDVIDLAQQLKQAHWCVKGAGFLPVHEQLDDIVESARNASDEIAERMSMLGVAPQGHTQKTATATRLEQYPDTFVNVDKTLTLIADRLDKTIQGLRTAIAAVGEPDPITEDLLIGISADLEKHLWFVQAHEGEAR